MGAPDRGGLKSMVFQGGEKWSDPGYSLKVESTGFPNPSDVELERNKSKVLVLSKWKGILINCLAGLVRRSILDMLCLKCLLDFKLEMPNWQQK